MSQHMLYSHSRIRYIPLADIDVPPIYRRRKWTSEDDELVRSIARYGVLLPISLRYGNEKFELISGTRRFYASRRAGLHKIPAVIFDIDSPEGELIAFTENMQRKSLDFVEEAEKLHRLITTHGISQEEAAKRMGKSPSSISNKLRLLNMPKELLYTARDAGLTERHVRALLRLSNSRTIASVMDKIIDNNMSVDEAEKYIDNLLNPKSENIFVFSDIGLYLNTIERGGETMRKSGYTVEIVKEETSEQIDMHITLSKFPSLC